MLNWTDVKLGNIKLNNAELAKFKLDNVELIDVDDDDLGKVYLRKETGKPITSLNSWVGD